MKRIFLIALICGLCGCAQSLLDKVTGVGQSTGNKIIVQPDTVYMKPDGWVFPQPYNPGMPTHPLAAGNGWMFYFPDRDGVHYVLVPYNALKPHKTLTITYRVTAISGDPRFLSVDSCSPNEAASFRPMLERKGDMMVASQEFYRWWSTPTKLVADGQTHTVTYPLTPDKWTAVFGKSNASEFAATWNGDLMAVGISFGGCYAAHGASETGGKARFELLNYQIQ